MSISGNKIWKKYYPEGALEMTPPSMTAYRFMHSRNKDRTESTALRYYGTDISFGDFFEAIERIAAAFDFLGVKAGEIVSFLSVAVPECIEALYAVNKLGATANTMDPRMDRETLRRMIKNSGSEILVVLDAAFPKIEPVLSDISQKKIIVLSASESLPPLKKLSVRLRSRQKLPFGEKIVSWPDFLALGNDRTVEDAPYVGDAAFVITYTGGTTGFPKGVLLTNDSVNAAAFSFLHHGIDQQPGDVFLGIIPVFTSYGAVCGMHMPLCMSWTLAPIPKFDPKKLGELVRSIRPNHMISTPAFYEMMMESPAVRRLDMSFLKSMGSGGDTMNEGLEQKLSAFMKAHKVPYPLAQGYGMSEVSAAVSFCINDRYKRGSVGIPLLCSTVSVFDETTGEELSYNEIGEVCLSGRTVMKGYHNAPEETDNILRKHSDGSMWIHSGDLGYIDHDGFLFIIGRIKRMITRFDGHKVYPHILESVVSESPLVRNCCVIGVPDREHSQGHQPLVLAELLPNADPASVCRKLYEECISRAEERGKPVAVLAVDKIPLTGAGKNDFRSLEREYAGFDYTNWDQKK